MRRFLSFPIAVLVAAAMLAMFASSGAAGPQNTCPPNPPPGSNVDGGLLVTGPCTLTMVTVNGGVTITSTGHLELENSTVNGGITIQAGGELDSGHTIGSNVATFLPSTIHGGISGTGVLDMDLDNATVFGTISIDGAASPFFAPTICGSTLEGSLKLNNVVAGNPGFTTRIGDPGEPFQAGPHPDCPGNNIDGSVFITNSVNVEIEGNTIMGSVHISNSTVELAGNTIEGSAKCSGVVPFTDGDHTPNTVGGSNNCP